MFADRLVNDWYVLRVKENGVKSDGMHVEKFLNVAADALKFGDLRDPIPSVSRRYA